MSWFSSSGASLYCMTIVFIMKPQGSARNVIKALLRLPCWRFIISRLENECLFAPPYFYGPCMWKFRYVSLNTHYEIFLGEDPFIFRCPLGLESCYFETISLNIYMLCCMKIKMDTRCFAPSCCIEIPPVTCSRRRWAAASLDFHSLDMGNSATKIFS